MAMNDLLSDMVTRIRNGQKARLNTIDSLYSGLLESVCSVLLSEGYISSYEKTGTDKKPALSIGLKYYDGGPAIQNIRRISKPGRREFSPILKLKKVNNGLGTSIVSTSKGVLSDHDARQQNVGGEVLCEVF